MFNKALLSQSEEVGHIFLTSPASFPGLGPSENVNCQREVKGSLKGRSTLKTLQVGRLPVGVPRVWLLRHPTRPILQEAVQPGVERG